MRHHLLHSVILLLFSFYNISSWILPRSNLNEGQIIVTPFRNKPRQLKDVVITPRQGPFQIPYKELRESAFWDQDHFQNLLNQGIRLYGKSLHPLASKWINRRLKKININNDPKITYAIDKFTESLSRDITNNIDDNTVEIDRVDETNLDYYILSLWDYFQTTHFKSLIPASEDMEFCLSDSKLDTISEFPFCKNDFYTFWDGDSLSLPMLIFYKPLIFDGKCHKNLLKLTVFRSICELFYNLHWEDEIDKNVEKFKILPKIISTCEKSGAFTTITRNKPFNSMDSALINSNETHSNDKFPFTFHNPEILTFKPKEWDNLLEIPPNINTPLGYSSMDLFKSTTSKTAKGTKIVENISTMRIPIDEFARALLKGSLEDAAGIISLGYDRLLLLKPVQLNYVENAFVTTCESLLKPYSQLNQTRDDSIVDEIQNTIIKGYQFIRRLFAKIRSTNGYPALDSSFLSMPESSVLSSTPLESRPEKLGELARDFVPVIFPNEYLNDLIAIDDISALEYILNFYNFNLFGGRLPTILHVKFADLPSNTLSSNDSTHTFLSPITVYLSHELLHKHKDLSIRDMKIIISRLLLDECLKIFKRSVNINVDFWSDDLISLHISHLIEKSNCWPFHYVDYSTIRDTKPIDLIAEMKPRYFRESMDDYISTSTLPLKLFCSLAYSGNLLMIESLLCSKNSINYFTKLGFKELILYENLLKEGIKSAFNGNNIDILAEAIGSIDVSFENIRNEWHVHNIISSQTIMEGLLHSYNMEAESRGEAIGEERLYPFGPFGEFVLLDAHKVKIQHLDVEPYIECLRRGEIRHLDDIERRDVVSNLYRYYNEMIFSNALDNVSIRFNDIWRSGFLSKLEYQNLVPIITIDEHVSDLKMLNDLLLMQMLKLHYMYKVNTAFNVFKELLPEYELAFPTASRMVKMKFDEKYLASFKYPVTTKVAVPGTLKSLRIMHFVNQILQGRCASETKNLDPSIETSLYGFAHYLMESKDMDLKDDNPISFMENVPNIEYFRPMFDKLNIPYTIGQLDQNWINRLTDDESLALSHVTENSNVVGMLVSAGFDIGRILNLLSPNDQEYKYNKVEDKSTELEHIKEDKVDDEKRLISDIVGEYEPRIIHYTGAIVDEILNNRIEEARKFIWSLESDVREQIISLSTRLIEGMKACNSITEDIGDKALKNLTQILL